MKRAIIALAVLGWVGTTAVAWGYTPRSEEMARVRILAQALAEATERLYGDAATNSHRGGPERRALRSLADLESRSRFFRRQVEVPGLDPAETKDDFDQVVAAYTLASSSLDDLHAYEVVLTDFNAVERTMTELTDIYGGQGRYWGRHERGGRRPVTVPAETTIGVRLRSALRSRDLYNGQEVVAALADDIVVSGRVVAARESDALLRVTKVKESGRVKGREQVSFELAGIRIAGKLQTVDSDEVTLRAEGSGDRDAGVIAGAAAVGAIIGAIAGHDGDDAAKGALVGGAAGTGVVLTTRGKTVELPPGFRMDFTLTRPLPLYLPGDRRDRDEPSGDRDEPSGVSRR